MHVRQLAASTCQRCCHAGKDKCKTFDKCQPSCKADTDTPLRHGQLHPRPKKEIGERLAQAAMAVVYGGKGPVTGPTVSGCAVQGNQLSVKWSLSGGDALTMKDYMSRNNSQLQVLPAGSPFCMQWDKTYTHCNSTNTSYTSPGTGWVSVDFKQSGASVTADLSGVKGPIQAVRYAWAEQTDSCCLASPDQVWDCEPGSCPLYGQSGLPANPFLARVVAGKCACLAPQKCDGGAEVEPSVWVV